MTETTLLDIKSDYIFKLVFGNEKNKKVLLSLLNAILNDPRRKQRGINGLLQLFLMITPQVAGNQTLSD